MFISDLTRKCGKSKYLAEYCVDKSWCSLNDLISICESKYKTCLNNVNIGELFRRFTIQEMKSLSPYYNLFNPTIIPYATLSQIYAIESLYEIVSLREILYVLSDDYIKLKLISKVSCEAPIKYELIKINKLLDNITDLQLTTAVTKKHPFIRRPKNIDFLYSVQFYFE